MDHQSLKTLLLVRDLGSFAAAARALAVDPSSVSRSVGLIEADLGIRVFQRTTRRLAVTEAGGRYLDRVAPLIEEIELAREEALSGTATVSGHLRLTASVAFAQECIVPQMGDFLAAHPEVTVEILPSDQNLDLLQNGIDLAIRLLAAPEGDLISTRLCRTRYRVVASPGYLKAEGALPVPGDLAGRDCVRFALPGFRDRWIFRGEGKDPFEVPVKGRFATTGALAVLQAARDGLGPAMLPDWLVARHLDEGALVDLFPNHDATGTTFDTGAWALYPSRSYLPGKVRAMIDFLRQRLSHRV